MLGFRLIGTLEPGEPAVAAAPPVAPPAPPPRTARLWSSDR